MKTITVFYLRHCPFCKKAFAYMDELLQQEPYKGLHTEKIEETEQPDVADRYDYYYVPTFYIDGEKVHEGGIFRDEVKALFDKALE